MSNSGIIEPSSSQWRRDHYTFWSTWSSSLSCRLFYIQHLQETETGRLWKLLHHVFGRCSTIRNGLDLQNPELAENAEHLLYLAGWNQKLHGLHPLPCHEQLWPSMPLRVHWGTSLMLNSSPEWIKNVCVGVLTWSQTNSHFFSLSYWRSSFTLSGGRFMEF